MTVSIPTVNVGDNVLNTLNSNYDLIENAINTFDGGLIQNATVNNLALVKPKAFHTVVVPFQALSVDLGTGIIYAWRLPNVDGASNNTWRYLGGSAYIRGSTLTAGNTVDVRKNGVSAHGTPPINLATLAAGSPVLFAPAAAVASSSNDVWDVFYTEAGAPVFTGLYVALYFSLVHVGT